MKMKKRIFSSFPLGKKGLILLMVFLVSVISVNAESIFLSGYLREGETTVYETEDGVYVLNLLSVSEAKEKAVFRLNDEMSKGIKLKDSYVFDDGSEIVLRELIISDAEDGVDEAYYYFYGTGENVLKLRNVSRHVVENKLCNFDTQCLNETKEECCYDCGCNEEEECVNNECVSTKKEEEEKKEDVEEEVEEEVEEDVETEERKELTKDEKEKKAAYAMLVVIAFFIVILVWLVVRKKRSIF